MTETESYWKRPDPQTTAAHKQAPRVGVWSRSRALRAVVWIAALVLTIFLALLVSAYLSGFNSVFEMLGWLYESLQKM
jgi:hypothetical protein